MSATQRLFVLHTHSPVHIGGEIGIGSVDLPTLREAHTGFPLIPGSSLKGVLRAMCGSEHDAKRLFGPDNAHASEHRGALVIGDAQLLALPVRSLRGTFAWVTSPLLLHRLSRDLQSAAGKGLDVPELRSGEVWVTTKSRLQHKGLDHKSAVYLESYQLKDPQARADTLAKQLRERLSLGSESTLGTFEERLAVVSDEVMTWLARLHLELRHRVKIDEETGTAASSGPWVEEHIPAETLLVGTLRGRAVKTDKGSWSAETALESGLKLLGGPQALRVGGKGSVGLGRVHLHLVGG